MVLVYKAIMYNWHIYIRKKLIMDNIGDISNIGDINNIGDMDNIDYIKLEEQKQDEYCCCEAFLCIGNICVFIMEICVF